MEQVLSKQLLNKWPCQLRTCLLPYLKTKQLLQLAADPFFMSFFALEQFIQSAFHLHSLRKIVWQEYDFQQKIKDQQQLPFWGISTDGGIKFNNLRYAFGKIFTRSVRPFCCFRRQTMVKVRGLLCQEIIDFKNNLTQGAKFIRERMKEVNLPQKMSGLQIFQMFRCMYQLRYVSEVEEFQQLYRPFYQYIHSMIEAINTSLLTDSFRINLPFQQISALALVTTLIVSAQTPFRNVQSLLISVGIGQQTALQYRRGSLGYCQFRTQKLNAIKEPGFIVFQSASRARIAVFIRLVPNKTFKLKLLLEQRVWTQSVQLTLMQPQSCDQSNQQLYDIEGISVGYVSLRGVLFSI